MARGRLFSRRYEQKPPEEVEKSRNPLVQLGITFKKLQKLAPEPHPRTPPSEDTPRRPLVDIQEVRHYLRAKLGITKPISTIPLPPSQFPPHAHLHRESNPSETTHVTSNHSFSSEPSSLPSHDAAKGSQPFDIGTVGHPVVEAEEDPHHTVFSSADEHGVAAFRPPRGRKTTVEVRDQGGVATRLEVREPAARPSTIILEVYEQAYTWVVEPPKLEMRDVQEFVRRVMELCRRIEHWGLPETSWENKMPWHSPPPRILARGLQRPPERFASEEERLAFNRQARKRKPFLTTCPPTWSFMIANLALVAFLVYNPLG